MSILSTDHTKKKVIVNFRVHRLTAKLRWLVNVWAGSNFTASFLTCDHLWYVSAKNVNSSKFFVTSFHRKRMGWTIETLRLPFTANG